MARSSERLEVGDRAFAAAATAAAKRRSQRIVLQTTVAIRAVSSSTKNPTMRPGSNDSGARSGVGGAAPVGCMNSQMARNSITRRTQSASTLPRERSGCFVVGLATRSSARRMRPGGTGSSGGCSVAFASVVRARARRAKGAAAGAIVATQSATLGSSRGSAASRTGALR
jgi:hypothetical protein